MSGDRIFEKIFGTSIKEIRQKNISKRESIERVKKLKKAKEAGMYPADIDQEAKKLSKELGTSYEDAVEYIKDEKKAAARKATLQKVGGFLRQVGQKAREDTARRYQQPTGLSSLKTNFPQLDIPKKKILQRDYLKKKY